MTRLQASLQQTIGLLLSLLVYYRPRSRGHSLRRLYAPFIRRGDLCFDVGAHVGSRTRSWIDLGARVVALEPHPGCMRWLRILYGRHKRVVLVEKAVGPEPSLQTFWMSRLNPSVSSLSRTWIESVRRSRGFASVEWQEQTLVEVTTLDALIQHYGLPAFCKIDVEGSELSVLHGLSRPLKALSFEYIPAAVGTALACIDRLADLDEYEFNWSVGESARLGSAEWSGPQAIAARLVELPREGRSGDIYARRKKPDS